MSTQNQSPSRVVVTAPAGFGKTTLLAQTLVTHSEPAAWLTLDEHDSDLPTFVRYLVAAIQTANPARGLALARRLHTGMIHINDQTIADEPNAPLGGVGISGNGGRFGSMAEWDEFTQWQWVTARPQAHGFPF